MQNHQRIEDFVEELDEFSGGVLTRKTDLGFLLELASSNNEKDKFERLAFLAKFAGKSRKIMERIGRNGEGYDKIASELSAALEEVVTLLAHLTSFAPDAKSSRFSQTYLSHTPEALQQLFSLLTDISWYKNWTIDNRDWTL